MDELLLDRVRDGLEHEAGCIDVGDAAHGLAGAHRTARHRHRRNVLAVAAACTLAVVTGAAIIAAVSGNEPDSIRVDTPPTTLPDPDASDDDGADPEEAAELAEVADDPIVAEQSIEPATEPALVGVPSPTVITGAARRARGAPVRGFEPGGFQVVESIFPWQDGFLIAQVDEIQPSPPPLSDELNSRFPQEVLDLFPDGLPPTLDEATEVLSEAGMLMDVVEIIDADPELQAALFGEPVTSVLRLDFSTDGETWTSLQATVPQEVTRIEHVTVVDDRLVVVGSPPTPSNSVPESIGVAWTTDLVDWQVDTLPVDVPPPLPTSFFVDFGAFEPLLANGAGWLLRTEMWVDIDAQPFLPDEFQDSQYGHGSRWTETGLRITPWDEAGERSSDAVTIGWAELGLDDTQRAFLQSLDRSDGPQSLAWGGSWDSPAQEVGNVAHQEIVVLHDGFVEFTRTEDERVARFTRDWQTWDAVDGLPPNHWISSTLHLEDATVVVTRDSTDETHAHLVSDGAQTWTPIEIDGLPILGPNPTGTRETRNGATIVDAQPPQEYEVSGTIDLGTMRLTLTDTRTTRAYELVDMASGDIVAAEETAVLEIVDQRAPFQHLREGVETVIVSDSVTDSELASIPLDDYRSARSDMEAEWYESYRLRRPWDLWLVATTDGVNWVVDELGVIDAFGDQEWFPPAVAANAGTVLVSGPEGWLRYEL